MKFFRFFSKYFSMFTDFVISDDCIEKFTSKSIRLPVLFKKRFQVNKKQIFSSENIINSGNCIQDYAHSFFGDEF